MWTKEEHGLFKTLQPLQHYRIISVVIMTKNPVEIWLSFDMILWNGVTFPCNFSLRILIVFLLKISRKKWERPHRLGRGWKEALQHDQSARQIVAEDRT